MSDELESRLSRLAREVEAAWPAPEPSTSGRLGAGVTRRRRIRALTRSTAAVAALAVLVPAVALGAGRFHASPPAIVPGPTTSASPAASSTTSPSPTTTAAPVTREDKIDDATVLARIASPRTGEVWTTPRRADELTPVLAKGLSGWVPYLVGHRGPASIYAVVDTSSGFVDGDDYGHHTPGTIGLIAEVDSTGARKIACPSARSSDPCDDDQSSVQVTGLAVDRATFYDSLTLPSAIQLSPGWTLHTPQGFDSFMYGSPVWAGAASSASVESVTNVGALKVVEERIGDPQPGETVDNRIFELETTLGTTVLLDAGSLPGADYNSIRWDDGKKRQSRIRHDDSPLARSAGGDGCNTGDFSEQAGLSLAAWTRAGTTADGHLVYVPAPTNPLPDAVRAQRLALSDGYSGESPFKTDAAFRAADALYAVQGPDGSWQLRLRADAAAYASCDDYGMGGGD